MTTSLSKSTIPTYDPNDSYMSPRSKPKVRPEAQSNYMKHRGSLDLGTWAVESKDYHTPRMPIRVKEEQAKKTYQQSQGGNMKESLGGYADAVGGNRAQRKGPRVKREAEVNFNKSKGTFSECLSDYGKDIRPSQLNPRVYREGRENNLKGNGSMGALFGNYGNHPADKRPVSRVKYEGAHILANNRGSGVSKTLTMQPESHRPKSGAFFNSTQFLK